MSTLITPEVLPANEVVPATPRSKPVLGASIYGDSDAVLELLRKWLWTHCSTVRIFRSVLDHDARSAALDPSPDTLFFLASGDELIVLKRSREAGGCVNCLQTRRIAFKSYAEIMAARGGKAHDVPALALYTSFAQEVLNSLLPVLADAVLDGPSRGFCLQLRTLQVIPFVLARNSSCTLCGRADKEPISPEGLWTNSQLKPRDDSYRTKTLDELSFDVAELVNPVCGM